MSSKYHSNNGNNAVIKIRKIKSGRIFSDFLKMFQRPLFEDIFLEMFTLVSIHKQNYSYSSIFRTKKPTCYTVNYFLINLLKVTSATKR